MLRNRIFKLAATGIIAAAPLAGIGVMSGGTALAATRYPTSSSFAGRPDGALAGLHFVPVKTATVRIDGKVTPDLSFGYIESKSGKCLDAMSQDYPSNGDTLQLWTCENNDEQMWGWAPAGGASNLVNIEGPCVDADSNHFPDNGDVIQLWSCNSNPEQLWNHPAAGSYGTISNPVDSAGCLDAMSQDYPDNGDPIQLWTCGSTNEQQWSY